MPINIPSGLYTGGRSTFDTSPMTTQILKEDALEKARKAAEQKAAKAAIDKNYERMQNAINVAGVRNIDIDDVKDPATGNVVAPGLKTQGENLLKKWTVDGKIDPVELNNYKFLVEQSKGYLKEGEKMHQGVVSGKLLPKKGDVEVVATQGRSMFDPNFKAYTEADMPASIPDLDEDKWNKGLFGSTKPLTQISQRVLPGNNQYETIYGYSNKEMKDFADIAASQVKTNPSALKRFTEKANDDSFKRVALPLFQKFYGAKELIDTPEKAAAASAILEAQTRKERQESSIYRAPRMAEWEYKLATGADQEDENSLNRWVANAAEQPPVPLKNAKGKATIISGLTIGGQKYEGKTISVPVEITDRFTVDKGYPTEQVPISFMLTKDKQKVIPIYQKTKEGKKQFTESGNIKLDTDSPYSRPMDIQDFKTQLAPSILRKKTSGQQITAPVNSTAPIQTGSSKTEKTAKRKYD